MSRALLIAGVLSCTLAMVGSAEAQGKGRGYGRGSGGGSGARLYVGPGYFNLNSGRYNLNYGDSYRYRNYGSYDPWYNSRYYYEPSYRSTYSRYSYYPDSGTYYSYPPASDSSYREEVSDNRGKIEVIVPDPEAAVT